MPMEKIKPVNKHISVCHVTTAHARTSSRIFDKFCKSAETDGYNVTYLVADGGQNETIDNVNIIALPKAKNRLFRFFVTPFLMVRTARALEADIYQLHDPELLLSALFFRKKKNIVLFDFHEDYPLQLLNRDYLKFGVKKIAAWLVKNIQFFISKRLDGAITATSTIGQKFVNRGIKTQVIRNLPKSEFFDREYVDWAQRENWIVHVGTLTKDRGIEELVDALPLMKQKARLKLCGVFSDPQFLAHLKTKDGWQYVDYLGFLDRGSVAEIVSHSKAGLVTLHPARNYMEEIRFVVPYNIHMKQWVPVNKIDTLIPKYKNDGFVFIPSSLPVIQNRNKQMYKYKKTHTIDFYIDEHDNMYGSSDGKLVLFDNFVPTENDTNLHSGVYECELVETRSNKFIFKRVIQRLDKKCGNDVDTINSTIKAITINKISYEDLVDICTT